MSSRGFEAVSDFLSPGQRFRVVENTYRPELNGQERHAVKTGVGVLQFRVDATGEIGWTSNVRFHPNSDGTHTTPMSVPGSHSLTIEVL